MKAVARAMGSNTDTPTTRMHDTGARTTSTHRPTVFARRELARARVERDCRRRSEKGLLRPAGTMQQ